MRHARTIRYVTDEFGRSWPVPAGGADDDTAEDDQSADADADDTSAAAEDDADEGDGDGPDDDTSGDGLGDAGKQALDRMKAKWKAERDRRKELEAAAQAAPGDGDGDDVDLDAIRAQAAQEATQRANERIVRSEVKAAAAGKLADPADAYKFLDLTEFEVDDNGDVDEDEIADAIADLVKRKPYLAVQDGRTFQGKADSGARNGSGKAGQLTRDDLKRMSAEQITAAEAEGRLDSLLGRST